MIQIRYYQEEAITAIYDYFAAETGNPIVAHPGGTGKSVVIAEFCRSVLAHWPLERILCLTHVKELIEQNFNKLRFIWPLAPAGIYSAGLRKREVMPITFAGIGSVVKRAEIFGHVDIVIIDECHLLSPMEDTNYQNFIKDLREINPCLKVIGLSATPYRMGQGLLTEPFEGKKGIKQPLFTHICHNLTGLDAFNRFVREGFLCRLVSKKTDNDFDLSKVKVTAGEYNLADMQRTVDKKEITAKACEEMMYWGEAQSRRRWIIFAAGVEHAMHVTDELRSKGVAAFCVHSKTPSKNRDEIINWYRAPADGRTRAIVNNGVLTTGFDCPEIDLIGMLRGTKSVPLWVQMLSRGTRPAPGKESCLVLDFAGNTRRLGPINDPVLPRPKGKGENKGAPVKICDSCECYNHAKVRFCIECGAEFPEKPNFNDIAGTDEVMKSEAPKIVIFAVNKVTYSKYVSKKGDKPPSLKVTYICGLRMFYQHVCLEHPNYAGKRGRDWWRERSPDEPPATIDEAIPRIAELTQPTHIRVVVNMKWPEILAFDFTGTAFGTKKKGSNKINNDNNVNVEGVGYNENDLEDEPF